MFDLRTHRHTGQRWFRCFRLFACLLWIAGLSLHAPCAQAQTEILFDPVPVSLAVGDSSSVDILVRNVTNLYAWQFSLTYDPKVVTVTAITEGSFLATGQPTFFLPGAIDTTAGTIGLTADTRLGAVPGATGTGVLATLSFTGAAEGVTEPTFGNVQLLDSNLNPIAATAIPGTIIVTPEPSLTALGAAMLMVVLGLCGRQQTQRCRAARSHRLSGLAKDNHTRKLRRRCPVAQALRPLTLLVGLMATLSVTQPVASGQQMPRPTRPLIVLPGIGGSTLGIPNNANVPGWPGSVIVGGDPTNLEFTNMGTPTPGNSTMMQATGFIPTPRDYTNLINYFIGIGYVRGQTLFPLPYDFRFPVLSNAVLLGLFINTLAKLAGPVDIVAHSTGGLIVKAALQSIPNGLVANVVLVDTPHLGAPKLLKSLRYGDDVGSSFIDDRLLKRAEHNLPGAINLLPSPRYFTVSTGYFNNKANIDGSGLIRLLDYTETLNALKNGPETICTLLPADQQPRTMIDANLLDTQVTLFHDGMAQNGLDYWTRPNGTNVYMIAGYNQATIRCYAEANIPGFGRTAWPFFTTEGDGTVPLRSAEVVDANQIYYANLAALNNSDHFSMLSNPAVQMQIGGLLLRGPGIYGNNIVVNRPNMFGRGILFVKYGQGNLLVTDANRNQTGVTLFGQSTAIPTSGIYLLDKRNYPNMQAVYVPEGANYTVTVSGAAANGNVMVWQSEVDPSGLPLRTLTWGNVPLNPGWSYQLATGYGVQPPMLTAGAAQQGQPMRTAPTTFPGGGGPLMLADLNGDGRIDANDLKLIMNSFGKKRGEAGYNPLADVNDDGVVDVFDLAWVGQAQ